jgi:hypothetical protein
MAEKHQSTNNFGVFKEDNALQQSAKGKPSSRQATLHIQFSNNWSIVA